MTEENKQSDKTEAEIKLQEHEQRCEEYLNNWKRERADFLNYKKDEIKRLEGFVKFANEAIILEIVGVLDDLERAVKEVGDEGLGQVLKKFQDLLKKYDVERIKVEGAFDPLLHEAITTEAQNEIVETRNEEEKNEETIEEVGAGYTMHGKVIRPARVKITK